MLDRNVFLRKLETALEFNEGEIKEDKPVIEFDSVNIMGLVSLVDEEYNITLFPKDISDCNNIGDIINLINSK